MAFSMPPDAPQDNRSRQPEHQPLPNNDFHGHASGDEKALGHGGILRVHASR